ncbi:hypothetical protein [Thermococcus sp.]|uniref:hypothetical protein n=1 Tax=Thermococcus sp. TaxID=35749 RepID=UPI00262DF5A0|nr:hypothetical protein [Thermococcus sp.]
MDPKLKQVMSGAGAGMTLAFLVVVKFLSTSAGIRGSLPFFLAGITLGALVGWTSKPVTNASAFAYPLGILVAFVLGALWFTGNATLTATLTITAAAVGALYLTAPLGFTDAALTPITYFGGMLTALMILGSVESLWETPGALLSINLSGIFGAVLAFFVVMFRFLVGFPQRMNR